MVFSQRKNKFIFQSSILCFQGYLIQYYLAQFKQLNTSMKNNLHIS